MLANGFQKIDGSQSVYFEIENGDITGFIVGRLRRAVDDQDKAIGFEKLIQPTAVADVNIDVLKILGRALEPVEIPRGIAWRSKKYPAHVIVQTYDAITLPIKMLDCFGSDQAAATRNEDCFHVLSIRNLSLLNFCALAGLRLAQLRLPDFTFLFANHRIAFLAAKCFGEDLHV
jgi:hypothetical protein